MAMLNSLESSRELSPETRAVFLSFVGFQAMRTPRARERLNEIDQRLLSEIGSPSGATKAVEAIVAEKRVGGWAALGVWDF